MVGQMADRWSAPDVRHVREPAPGLSGRTELFPSAANSRGGCVPGVPRRPATGSGQPGVGGRVSLVGRSYVGAPGPEEDGASIRCRPSVRGAVLARPAGAAAGPSAASASRSMVLMVDDCRSPCFVSHRLS